MPGAVVADDEARALAAARDTRERAYAPYSGFRVGAAVLAADGRLFRGANVENASYGLTACAERVALWTAVAAGITRIQLVALVTDTPRPVTPCGACRQVLVELAPDALVVMATLGGQLQRSTVRALLPGAFGAGSISPALSAARGEERQRDGEGQHAGSGGGVDPPGAQAPGSMHEAG